MKPCDVLGRRRGYTTGYAPHEPSPQVGCDYIRAATAFEHIVRSGAKIAVPLLAVYRTATFSAASPLVSREQVRVFVANSIVIYGLVV
jgi:hypothetical protein